MDARQKILDTFLADTTQFHDCFTLSIELGLDLHEVALAIASIEREYETIIDVRPVNFYFDTENGRNKQGRQGVDFKVYPVSFYRLTGRTLHETAQHGDNRTRPWRHMIKDY